MDRQEATLILRRYLDELAALDYPELSKRVGQDECFKQNAPYGRSYQLEVSLFWDSDPGGPIRNPECRFSGAEGTKLKSRLRRV